jgi:hypothetical protein
MRAELTLQIFHLRFIYMCLLVVYACRAHLTKNSHIVYITVFIGCLRAELTLLKIHIRLHYCVYWLFMFAELTLKKIPISFILLCLLDVYACRANLTKNSHKVYINVFIGCLC